MTGWGVVGSGDGTTVLRQVRHECVVVVYEVLRSVEHRSTSFE